MATSARSKNDLPLKVGDMVRLVGKRPQNPVVGYVGEMSKFMNNGKYYKIKKISASRMGRWIIRVNNWNWDTRNVYKRDPKDAPPIPKPVMFDELLLDI